MNSTNGVHHRLSDDDGGARPHHFNDVDDDDHHCNNSSMNEYVCSSPSNSRLSSFQEDGDDSSLNSELSDDYGLDVDSDTENATTPVRKPTSTQERDSGTASASNSMLKTSQDHHHHHRLNHMNGPKTIDADELLRKLNKVKKNYRVKFEDSDSD